MIQQMSLAQIHASSPRATVVITTKNRKEDLRLAVASCFKQSVVPEVLVVDDGSTDGTAEMITAEFPNATLIRFEQSAGYIARRNLGAERAKAPIIFSIDDDAILEHPRIIEDTLAEFDDDRIGAVAIPHVNTPYGPQVEDRAPDKTTRWASFMFRGTAHAVRRDVFLNCGAYEANLTHQGEEIDFCIRMFRAGYLVRLGSSAPITHNESPRRDLTRMLFHNARNHLIYAWQNIPMPYYVPRAAVMCLKLSIYGVKKRYIKATTRGLWQGFVKSFSGTFPRQPLPGPVYGAYRKLQTSQRLRWDEALKLVPPPSR